MKSGGRSYVVGPFSERRDGGLYLPVKGQLGQDPLTVLGGAIAPPSPHNPPSPRDALGDKVATGGRHSAMTRAAIDLVAQATGPDDLTAQLCAIRERQCEAPETLPDAELRAIADWAWERLLRGELFYGRDSTFKVHRLALDALRGKRGGSDAIALFVLLCDLHGHTPAKRFALDHAAMLEAGLTDLSARAFRAARRMLETNGLLHLASKHIAGKARQTYQLHQLRPAMASAPNVLPMAREISAPSVGGRGGEGLRLHMTRNSAPLGGGENGKL